MIPHDPDEDADLLENDAMMESYLGVSSNTSEAGGDASQVMPDWPPETDFFDTDLAADQETVDWFKARYVNRRGAWC